MEEMVPIDRILLSHNMMDKFISFTSYETKQQRQETLGFALGMEVDGAAAGDMVPAATNRSHMIHTYHRFEGLCSDT